MHPFLRQLLPVQSQPNLARREGQGSVGVDTWEEPPLPPFLLENRSHEVKPDGSFKPDSRVSLSPDFGASGLLQAVSPEDLVTLLLVLSRVTPSGAFIATPESLAPLCGTSSARMRRRLEGLASLRWQVKPLVMTIKAENGLRLFVPSSHLFGLQSNAIVPIPQGQQARDVMAFDEQRLPASHREESVARSRQLYARPRAEVEDEIERFLSGKQIITDGSEAIPRQVATEKADMAEVPEEQIPEGHQASEGRRWLSLKKRLSEVGLSQAQAKTLLNSYPFERIERQLDWLPHREARNPVAYLLASVNGDYAPPLLPAATASQISSGLETDDG